MGSYLIASITYRQPFLHEDNLCSILILLNLMCSYQLKEILIFVTLRDHPSINQFSVLSSSAPVMTRDAL
jgi:hypothetical protein